MMTCYDGKILGIMQKQSKKEESKKANKQITKTAKGKCGFKPIHAIQQVARNKKQKCSEKNK